MPSEVRQKKIMEKLNRASFCCRRRSGVVRVKLAAPGPTHGSFWVFNAYAFSYILGALFLSFLTGSSTPKTDIKYI